MTAKDHNLPNRAVKDMEASLCINESSEILLDSTEIARVRAVRRRSLWNLFIFSLTYFLVYTGFWALANLQSTMNASQGMGDDSQAVIYVCTTLSAVLLPAYTIGRFGCKSVLIAGTLICTLNLASNMYLSWFTLIPASVLFGLANGPFQSAQSLYVNEMATRFQGTLKENTESVMAAFFGVFMFFSESTQICGNLISYYVLRSDRPDPSPAGNGTFHSECGVQFLPSDNDTNSNLDPPTDNQRFILVGVFVLMGITAILVQVCFLDPLKNDIRDFRGCRVVVNRFLSAFQLLKNPKQLLLVPLLIYIGMEGPFYTNEITQAYIACSWGVHHVGFVMVCFGVGGALIGLLVGPLVKCTSQMAVLVLTACTTVVVCIVLFFWKPSPDFTPAYFISAGVWGMGDAIWWSQVPALLGLMFPNDREAAFSNLYFWSSVSTFAAYSYSQYFTVAVKIYMLLGVLVVGMIGYLVALFDIRCTAAKEYVAIPNSDDE